MKALIVSSASWIWSSATLLARFLCKLGVLRPVALGCRVISVGNIQAGGAGKTPLVAQIACEAQKRGLRVCILTRGYKGRRESDGGVLCPGDLALASEWGDEAALLHHLVPQAFFGIGKKRSLQFSKLKAQGAFDLVILDDGFQHWRIRKDLEIVALSSARPWEVPFRDFRFSLRNADLLVWTKGSRRPVDNDKAVVRTRYRLPIADGEPPLFLVTSVADGPSVKQGVLEAGYSVMKHVCLRDHEDFEEKGVAGILKEIQNHHPCQLAMTGKDWVKWREFDSNSPVLILEPTLEFLEGKELWEKTLWGTLRSLSSD